MERQQRLPPDAAPAPAPTTAPAPGRRWVALLPPVLTIVISVLALGESSEWFTTAGGFDTFTLGVLLWSWSPAAVLLVLTLRAARSRASRTRRTIVGVGAVVLLLLTASASWVIRTDDSSTAALGYLFVPAWGWLVVVLTAVALGVAALAGRRTSR